MKTVINLQEHFHTLSFRLQGTLNTANSFAQQTGKKHVALHQKDFDAIVAATLPEGVSLLNASLWTFLLYDVEIAGYAA